MIQDIYPHRLNNQYRTELPKEDDYVLYFKGREVLVKKQDEDFLYMTYSDVETLTGEKKENLRFLFSIDERNFFLGDEKDVKEGALDDFQWVDHQMFRQLKPLYMSYAGVLGWQLYRWYQTRQFCGRCGKPMVHDEKERMMKCPECGVVEFPKICPAVIVGVIDGDRIMMTKYAGREYTRYALIAGFTEIGETPEETVIREVYEEVGLKVKNVTYYKSQPWPFSDTLLMGFFCELDGVADVTLDREELALAEWVHRDEITQKNDGISLTNEMIQMFKGGYSI